MTRLDGEKKSPLPWIIGLIVLALLAAGIYYFTTVKGTDAVVADQNGVELIDNAPGGLGIDNSANATDLNAADANMALSNGTDLNSTDANSAMIDGNAAMGNTSDTNSMDANAMDSNSAMNSGSMSIDNSASVNPMPAMTPASAAPAATPNDVVATRSKTIKTDDKTVTYSKSVKADGTTMNNKTIVAEPVKEAKKEAVKP